MHLTTSGLDRFYLSRIEVDDGLNSVHQEATLGIIRRLYDSKLLLHVMLGVELLLLKATWLTARVCSRTHRREVDARLDSESTD